MNNIIEPRHIKLFLETIHCNTKEKQNTILEPIQSMIVLSLLAYFPKGTKLSIYKNSLLLIEPSLSQGLVRWYYMDKKEDIHLLFSVIKRFLMFHKIEENKCYDMLRKKAIDGIQCLIDTYESSDRDSVIHTLKHYQFILENYTVFKNSDLLDNNPREQVFKNINSIYDNTFYSFIETFFSYIENESNLFFKKNYIDSIILFMKPKQEQIHRWIQDNLIYT
jgi:hypothetical protein